MDSTLELVTAGILRPVVLPAHLDWVTPDHAALILFLANAGEEGASKAALKKLKVQEMTALDLEVRGIVQWLNDRRGRPSHLALTWKGEDLAEILRAHARNSGKLSSKVPS